MYANGEPVFTVLSRTRVGYLVKVSGEGPTRQKALEVYEYITVPPPLHPLPIQPACLISK